MLPVKGEINVEEGMDDIETVVFRDENGEEVTFEVIDFIEVNDQEYVIAAMPDNDDEAFILRVESDDEGNETYITIDDDEEWEVVAEAYEELLDADEADDESYDWDDD